MEIRLAHFIEQNKKAASEKLRQIFQFIIKPSRFIRKLPEQKIIESPKAEHHHDPELDRELLRWGDEGGASQ